MKFSRELTWKAVETVIPHLKTLKENNISVNLTDAPKYLPVIPTDIPTLYPLEGR